MVFDFAPAPFCKVGTILLCPLFVAERKAMIGFPCPSSACAAPRMKSIWPPTPVKDSQIVKPLYYISYIIQLWLLNWQVPSRMPDFQLCQCATPALSVYPFAADKFRVCAGNFLFSKLNVFVYRVKKSLFAYCSFFHVHTNNRSSNKKRIILSVE